MNRVSQSTVSNPRVARQASGTSSPTQESDDGTDFLVARPRPQSTQVANNRALQIPTQVSLGTMQALTVQTHGSPPLSHTDSLPPHARAVTESLLEQLNALQRTPNMSRANRAAVVQSMHEALYGDARLPESVQDFLGAILWRAAEVQWEGDGSANSPQTTPSTAGVEQPPPMTAEQQRWHDATEHARQVMPELLCTYTHELPHTPVRGLDGRLYDLDALRTEGQRALAVDDNTLRRFIHTWVQHHDHPEELKEEALKTLSCPVTLNVFADPVIASDGHTYSRTSIERFFDRTPYQTRSPLTNQHIMTRQVHNAGQNEPRPERHPRSLVPSYGVIELLRRFPAGEVVVEPQRRAAPPQPRETAPETPQRAPSPAWQLGVEWDHQLALGLQQEASEPLQGDDQVSVTSSDVSDVESLDSAPSLMHQPPRPSHPAPNQAVMPYTPMRRPVASNPLANGVQFRFDADLPIPTFTLRLHLAPAFANAQTALLALQRYSHPEYRTTEEHLQYDQAIHGVFRQSRGIVGQLMDLDMYDMNAEGEARLTPQENGALSRMKLEAYRLLGTEHRDWYKSAFKQAGRVMRNPSAATRFFDLSREGLVAATLVNMPSFFGRLKWQDRRMYHDIARESFLALASEPNLLETPETLTLVAHMFYMKGDDAAATYALDSSDDRRPTKQAMDLANRIHKRHQRGYPLRSTYQTPQWFARQVDGLIRHNLR